MSKRVFLCTISDLEIQTKKVFDVEGTPVLVVRADGKYYAVSNKCPHLGLPLANGKTEGNSITCPFHGSKFNLSTGDNLDWVNGVAGVKFPEWSRRLLAMGKKPAPILTYPVFVEDGKLFIEF